MGVSPRESATAFAVRFLGVVPHAKQAQFLDCRAAVKVAACGRRWGKSKDCAIDALWFAMTRPGTVQFVVAPTTDQSRIIFDDARTMAEQGELAGAISHVVESPFPELTLVARDPSGEEVESVIKARSVGHDAKYLRGHGADRVIVDEAAFVPNKVLTDVVPPMLAASDYGELVLPSTPFGLQGAFYDYFLRGLSGDPNVRSFHFPTRTNPRISREYLERQRQEMTDLAYRTEYEAEFTGDLSAVFRHEVIQAAITTSIDPRPQPGRRYALGYDPAKYSDRSGVVIVDITEKPFQIVHVEDISGRDYLTQASRVFRLSQEYGRAAVLLDATSHDQMLEELVRQGVRAEGFGFTNQTKQELIDNLVLVMEHGDLGIPPDAYDLLRELSYYRFERTTAGNVRLGAPDRAGMHDDLVTALALAVWKSKRPRAMKWA